MTQKIALSLALCASLIYAADEKKIEEPQKKEETKKEAKTLTEAFKMAEVKGQIRAVYQSNSKLDGDSSSDSLAGGQTIHRDRPFLWRKSWSLFLYIQRDFKQKRYKRRGLLQP